MASINPLTQTLIGHPTFSRSIESHGSNHSTDTTAYGWRRTGTIGSEDVGTQTDQPGGTGSISGSGRTMASDYRRRKEDAILDISLESMKYNGGKIFSNKFIYLIN